jgi:hypothetical protein
MGGLIAGAQGLQATGLHGPIYAPDGTVLFDPRTDGALHNASKLTSYPLTIGTDVPHDTAAGVGALAANGTAANSTQWAGAANDIAQQALAAATNASTAGYVSTGNGLKATPSGTRVLVRANGQASNQTGGDGCGIAIFRNGTGIPAAGTSVGTDTEIVATAGYTATANRPFPWSLEWLDTGLLAGGPYYYYVAIIALAGGTGLILSAGAILAESR